MSEVSVVVSGHPRWHLAPVAYSFESSRDASTGPVNGTHVALVLAHNIFRTQWHAFCLMMLMIKRAGSSRTARYCAHSKLLYFSFFLRFSSCTQSCSGQICIRASSKLSPGPTGPSLTTFQNTLAECSAICTGCSLSALAASSAWLDAAGRGSWSG